MSKRSSLVWKAIAPLAVLGVIAAVPACVSSGGGKNDSDASGGTTSEPTTSSGGNEDGSGGSPATTSATNGGAATGTGTGPAGVACNALASPVITDFTYDTTSTDASKFSFGDYSTNASGWVIVWGNAGNTTDSDTTNDGTTTITQDFTGSSWHIKGNVANYGGFTPQFATVRCDSEGANCETLTCNKFDASKYAGIRFRIWGNIGTGGKLTMEVGSATNTLSQAWLKAHGEADAPASFGSCNGGAETSLNKYSQSVCASATAVMKIDSATEPSAGTYVELPWSAFKGGKPNASPNPAEITGFDWFFTWDGSTTFDFDFYIDDLEFMPKP